MEDAVTVYVVGEDDKRTAVEVPLGMSLSLMEVLKGTGYDIKATCGGMALCATCHIQVLEGLDDLHEAEDDELDMLDTIPNLTDESRLSCQLKANEQMEGLVFRVLGEE